MEIRQSPGGAKDTDKGLGCPEPTFLPTSTDTQDTELMLTGLKTFIYMDFIHSCWQTYNPRTVTVPNPFHKQ